MSFSITHDGNTSLTNTTGDVLFDNSATTSSAIFRLGADDSGSDFQVQNRSETPLLTCTGNGDVTTGNNLTIQGSLSKTTTETTDNTAGNVTYTPANFLSGRILRDPSGAIRTDVTPTAALMVAAITGVEVGSSFDFEIFNSASDDTEMVTISAGTGVL